MLRAVRRWKVGFMFESKKQLATLLLLASLGCFCLYCASAATGEEKPGRAAQKPSPYDGKTCTAASDDFFSAQVWVKVGSQTCIKCHKSGGDAEDSKFILLDPSRAVGDAKAQATNHNREAFTRMAKMQVDGQPRMLLKATDRIKHGGEAVLKADDADYRVLAEFVRRVNAPATTLKDALAQLKNAPPFFDGVVMVDDRLLLRRVTLSLAGRLPTQAELSIIAKEGLKGLPPLLDAIMKEDAFYDRLREGFNDIFLTLGNGEVDNAGTALSYEHFHKTRLWFQKFDLSHIEDEKARTEARRKITADEKKAMSEEPLKLIEHIVRNDLPFTEIVTADYIVVTPYTARSYGIYDEIKSQFKNPEDPFEYIPVKLKALVSGNATGTMDSATGFYPHAGLVSTFHYLRRYPTTETNRNRHRARMFYQHFLGVDMLDLAPRVGDAAAVAAKYDNPTMQASECVVCHRPMDPVAGLFQDFWKFDSGYGRRKGGWFTDMFAAGFEGEDLPAQERWRALQWLGERTAKDPRFAVAMVEHVHYLLTGRRTLLPPKDMEDSLYPARLRAYLEQRKHIEAAAVRFAGANFNLKEAFKDLIVSDFYRADGLATAVASASRKAELDDVGLFHMLSPEQVQRKLVAIFGQPWTELNGQLALLYGGIDSKQVTERAADPSGAMGAIHRQLSNEVACKQTALDFSRKPEDRRLFPKIEPDVLPGKSAEADAQIREAIVHLHERVLGRVDAVDSPQVQRTFELFAGIVSDASERKVEKVEIYTCRQGLLGPVPDPHYTVRAWRGVLTYLLRQQEFLYE